MPEISNATAQHSVSSEVDSRDESMADRAAAAPVNGSTWPFAAGGRSEMIATKQTFVSCGNLMPSY
jgi:hypothetical protein